MASHVTATYGTVQARIPRELLDAVARYATMHRFKVSELIREGLELRLEQGVPGRGAFPTLGPEEPAERSNTDVLQAIHTLQAAMPRTMQDAVRHVLKEQAARDVHTTRDVGHVPHEESAAQEGDASLVGHVPRESTASRPPGGHVLHQEDGVPYDAAKYVLGTRCVNGHTHAGTAQSLRFRTGKQECVVCKRLRDAAYKARKKAATQEGTP